MENLFADTIKQLNDTADHAARTVETRRRVFYGAISVLSTVRKYCEGINEDPVLGAAALAYALGIIARHIPKAERNEAIKDHLLLTIISANTELTMSEELKQMQDDDLVPTFPGETATKG